MMFLFKAGFNATENLMRLAKSKGIDEHPAIKNLVVYAMTFDKMLMCREFKSMLDSEAVEVMSRRFWGTMRAFENVSKLEDWKKLSSSGKDWKSKVNWSILEKVDVVSAGKDKLRVPQLEKELRKQFKDDALREKVLPASEVAEDGLPGF